VLLYPANRTTIGYRPKADLRRADLKRPPNLCLYRSFWTCGRSRDRNHSTGLANSAIIIRLALGPASSIAKWPSAAFTCRRPKLRNNICTLLIRITRFIIFKPPTLPDLVWPRFPSAFGWPRKSRDLWAFANWFLSPSSMMSHSSHRRSLYIQNSDQKAFSIATAPFDYVTRIAPDRFSRIGRWAAKSLSSNMADLDS
jgi:hypothetical protein